jgi:DNA-3-methyladenine glycosylase I
MKYHDEEWGVPAYDDTTLFRILLLETFQAGLSWITILNKEKISKLLLITLIIKNCTYYDKILDLLQDAGIIRNKLKVYQLPMHKLS